MRLRIVSDQSKTWRWLEPTALIMLGLAAVLTIAGMVLTGARHSNTRADVPVGNSQHQTSPPSPTAVFPVEQTVTVPEHNPEVSVETTSVVRPLPTLPRDTDEPRPGAREPRNRGARLRDTVSVVVVAVTEADAAELRQYPRRIGELIQRGSVFGVPNSTPVTITEAHAGLAQVHVLAGAFLGRDGWVRDNQVARK